MIFVFSRLLWASLIALMMGCQNLTRFESPPQRIIVTGPIASGKTTFLETFFKGKYEDLDPIAKKIMPLDLRMKIANHLLNGTIEQDPALFHQGAQILYEYILKNPNHVPVFEVSALGTYTSLLGSPLQKLYQDSLIVSVEHFDRGRFRTIDPNFLRVMQRVQKKPSIIDYSINDRFQSDLELRKLSSALLDRVCSSDQPYNTLPNPFLNVNPEFLEKKTVAFYLGSFDPFHKGHLQIIRKILEQKIADYVWIHPAYGEDRKKRTPWEVRFRCIQEALKDPAYSGLSQRVLVISNPYQLKEALQVLKKSLLISVFGEDLLEFYSKQRTPRYFFQKYVMKGHDLLSTQTRTEKDSLFTYPTDFESDPSLEGKYPMNGYVLEALTLPKASSFVIVTRPSQRKADLLEKIKILQISQQSYSLLSLNEPKNSTQIRSFFKNNQANLAKNDLPSSEYRYIENNKIYS